MENKGILKNKGIFLVMALMSIMFIGFVSANSVLFSSNSPISNSFEVGQTVSGMISISGSAITGINSFAPPNLTFTSNSPDVNTAIETCNAKGYSTSPTFVSNTVTFYCPVTFTTSGSYNAVVSYKFNDSTTTSNTVSNTIDFYVNPAPSISFNLYPSPYPNSTSNIFDEGQTVTAQISYLGTPEELSISNLMFKSASSDLFSLNSNGCSVIHTIIICPITFNSVNFATPSTITAYYTDEYGVSTSNTISLTVDPLSISATPTNQNLDVGQNSLIALNINEASGSDNRYVISNSLSYNGANIISNSILTNSSPTNYIFTPNQPGTYNAIFTITDTTTHYSVSTSSNWTVYSKPVVNIAVSNALNSDNSYSTDAGQFLTFHISSTGGTGAPIKVYLNCDPTSIGTFLDCYGSNFYFDSTSHGPYALVLLNSVNGFSNTISLQTINSPASDVNITGTFKDTGTSSSGTPKEFGLNQINFNTVQTLFGTPTPTTSNTVLDQGQFTYISTIGAGQGGVLPYIWTWFNSYNNSAYSKTSTTICPTNSGKSTTTNTNILTATCGFQTSTSTSPGSYNFKVNTTDAANFSLFSDPVLVTVNKALSISASASNTQIDVGQSSLLTNITEGGTGPYSYQWSEETPGTNTFTNITGATSATYNFVTTPTTSIGTYNFELFVKDSATTPVTKTSTPVSIIVNPDPTVSITPKTNTIMDVGQSVTFTATATSGTPPYSYQWYSISGGSNTIIPGSTSSTYKYTPDQSTAISLGVKITDNANFITYSTNIANITVYSMPTISVQSPSNTFMDVGQSTTLVSSVSKGTGKFSYLWTVSPPGSLIPSCSGLVSSDSNTIIYTPSSDTSCTAQVAVTDIGTSSYATPVITVTGIFTPITVYPTPTLSELTPSNAIIDLGQSETFNVIINGGSNKDMSLALYQSPENNVIGNGVTGAGDGVQTFPNFVPSLSENTFYVNGLDAGVTTPFDIPPTNLIHIQINPKLSSTISASNDSIAPNQESTLTSSITGGTQPYSYQWYMETPGTTNFVPINGGTSNTFNFNLNSMTSSGNYEFILSTTDSASTPETVNSISTSITVTQAFTSPKLVLDINASIKNDPDSGNIGYWALDNITRNIQVWQTTLRTPTTYNSYTSNIIDNGIATTFAGAVSPGSLTPYETKEPYNGVATLKGFDQITFTGTFTPGSYPVYTNGQQVASFNNEGTASYILLGNYSNQGKSAYTPASTFNHYLNEYFTLEPSTGYNFQIWGDTYTYSVYPPGNQVMTDNSISNPAVTGDIITYQVPTVTMSLANAEIIDYGQTESYSASIYNGIGNFPNTILYQYGSNTIPTTIDCSRSLLGVGCSGAGTFIPINSVNIGANGLGNINGNTVSFGSFTPSIGTDTYFVSAFDGGTSPPNTYSFISNTNTIYVYPDPTVTTNINKPTSLDLGSSITVSAVTSGGTGKFSYSWSTTGTCPGFTSSTSNSFTYTPTGVTNNCVINVLVTDIGVSPNASPSEYSVATASTQTITVNPALSSPPVLVSGKSFDQGETVEITTGSVQGGTPPYTYNFQVENKNLSKLFFTCTQIASGVCTFTATQTGIYNGTLSITDSATIPSTVYNSIPSYAVNPDFGLEGASTSTNTLIDSQITPVLITANIIGEGGTPPYTYDFTVQNATTGKTVFTEQTQNSMLGNSIVFNPPNNGIYQATAIIYDNATPQEYIQSSYSKAFLVGSAGAPTAVITPSKYVVDSGYTDNLTAQVFGGVGPFNVEFYNISGQKQIGSNVTIQSPGGSNSISFTTNTSYSLGLSFKIIVTDEHTGVTFNSLPKEVIINPALGSNLTLSNSTIDIGQPTVLSATIHGGTPPYSFTYEINGTTAGENSNVMATDSSNVLIPTINTFVLSGNIITKPGTYPINVLVQDIAGGSEVLSNTLVVNPAMEPTILSITPNSLTTAQSVSLSSTSETYGTSPYLYNFEIINTTTNTILVSSGYQTSNTFTSSASKLKGGNNAVVIVKDSAGTTSTSNVINFNVSQATTTTTTTPQNTGGSPGGGGGGGGASGGGGAGGGTPHPTVLNFTNATDTGYGVTNFAVPATTSVTKFNATFNLLMNFISPTQVGVSINGNPYTLQLKNQSVSIGTIDGNAYYVELSAISYLPLQNTATIYLYTSTPKSPNTNTKSSNNTVNPNTPSNVTTKSNVTNNTKSVNTTVNTTSIKTTTKQNTTSNTSNQSAQTNNTNTTQGTAPTNINDNSGLYTALGAIIVIIIILGILYYFFSSKKVPIKNKK